MQKTPTDNEIQAAINAGAAAVAGGEETRDYHRGKRRPSRARQLEHVLAICDDAALPLRRLAGMTFAHEIPLERELEVKRTTKSLETERRKLRKMRHPHLR